MLWRYSILWYMPSRSKWHLTSSVAQWTSEKFMNLCSPNFFTFAAERTWCDAVGSFLKHMSIYLTLLLFLLGWGAFSSGSLACAFAFGFGFGFAAGFDLGRAFLGITVLIRSGHKNLFNWYRKKRHRICIHVGSSLLLTINQKRPHTNRPSNSLLARCSKLHDSRSLGKGKRLRRKRRQGRKGTNVWALRSVLLMQMSWSRTGFWLHPKFSWDQPLAWVTQTKFLLVYIYIPIL